MVRESVEHLGRGKYVEAHEHDVVGEQHEPGELIGDLAVAEGVVSKVADVLDLGIFHDVPVHRHGGDPEQNTGPHHGDDTRDPSQDRERPCLSHDSETYLVAG